jgi:hypothetical protein
MICWFSRDEVRALIKNIRTLRAGHLQLSAYRKAIEEGIETITPSTSVQNSALSEIFRSSKDDPKKAIIDTWDVIAAVMESSGIKNKNEQVPDRNWIANALRKQKIDSKQFATLDDLRQTRNTVLLPNMESAAADAEQYIKLADALCRNIQATSNG